MSINNLSHLSKTITTCFLLAIFSFGCSWTSLVDTGVKQVMGDAKIQGLTLVIVDGQKTVMNKGYGFADVANTVPVTKNTVFRLGSISKVFTSISAQQLVEDGALDLDQPLNSYLPSFAIQSNPSSTASAVDVTPRHILTHRSGIASDFFHTNYTAMPPSLTEYTTQFDNEHLAQEPGNHFSYSNAAMTIMGGVIETLSGQSFLNYTQDNIFSPLGMTSSAFETNPAILNNLSSRFNWDGATSSYVELPHLALAEVPAGNLYSTGNDMAAFMKAVLKQQSGATVPGEESVLSATAWQEMFTKQNSNSTLDQITGKQVGLGWLLEDHYAGKAIKHGGDLSGFHSNMIIIPERNIGVFVSFNTNTALPASAISGLVLEMALKNLRNINKPAATAVADASWSEDQLNSLPGLYNSPEVGLSLNLVRDGDLLKVEGLGLDARLQLKEDGTARVVSNTNNQLLSPNVFTVSDYDGTSLIASSGFSLQKFTPVAIPATWAATVGNYLTTTTDYDATTYLPIGNVLTPSIIMIDDGVLKVILGGSGATHVLVPYSDDKAFIHGVGRSAGETVRLEAGGNIIAQGKHFIKQ